MLAAIQLSPPYATRLAFLGNRLYVDAFAGGALPMPCVFPVFKREIIRFYNDDLSDCYFNYNEIAAKVFRKIIDMKTDVILGFSTARA